MSAEAELEQKRLEIQLECERQELNSYLAMKERAEAYVAASLRHIAQIRRRQTQIDREGNAAI